MRPYCLLLVGLLDDDEGVDDDGAGLGPQNKVLKSEVSKHKQQLDRLKQKVGFCSPFF